MHLDIVKLKTVREHLAVDLESADVELEEMATVAVHLLLLNFNCGPNVEFRQSVVEVFALETLRGLLFELDVGAAGGELQGEDVLHVEARPIARPAVLGGLELEGHPPLGGEFLHGGQQDGLLTSKLDLLGLRKFLCPACLNICTWRESNFAQHFSRS